jgi:hypothetical protein
MFVKFCNFVTLLFISVQVFEFARKTEVTKRLQKGYKVTNGSIEPLSQDKSELLVMESSLAVATT